MRARHVAHVLLAGSLLWSCGSKEDGAPQDGDAGRHDASVPSTGDDDDDGDDDEAEGGEASDASDGGGPVVVDGGDASSAADSSVSDGGSPTAPTVLPTGSALTPTQLALIVNLDDPVSVAVAAYYQQKRAIPAANVVSVHVPRHATITSAVFAPIKAAVDAATPAGVQAYAVTWTQPFSVDGESITSAFALGVDDKWRNTSGGTCSMTAESPYYLQESTTPFTTFGVRPTMMLAGAAQQDVLDLIDRGIRSDNTYPTGTDYMIRTTDPSRSVRYPEFQAFAASWDPATGITPVYVDNSAGKGSNVITGKTDVLFYFQSLSTVPSITTNTYLPGALADHLTSSGGAVPTSGQMSVVAWLQAGATASYGSVEEPCNYTAKFPDPQLAIPRYYRGGTALESYWYSVQWPGEGLFVGEPLAQPSAKPRTTFVGGTLTIETTWLKPGHMYRLEGSASASGTFATVQDGISVTKVDVATLTVVHPTYAFYRIVLVS
jgi:uncharacterized protein (TIGR03790 family)